MAKKKKAESGPPCGSMVLDLAERLNMSWPDAVQQLLYYRFDVTLPVRGGERVPVSHMPGHIMGSGQPDPTPLPRGPQKSDVFVLTSHPNQMEERVQLYMSGSHGQEFRQACYAAGGDPTNWYVTSVCKFSYPQGRSAPLKAWVTDDAFLLQRELEIVKPKFILLMGALAVEAILPKHKLSHIRGSLQEWGAAKVYATYSPHNLTAAPEIQNEFYRDIGGFVQLINGTSPHLEYAVDVDILNSPESIQKFVDENMQHNVWSVDCEWGRNGKGKEKLRLIQLCAVPGKVGVVHLRSEGTKEKDMTVVMDERQAADILRPLLCRPEVKAIGHFARSDLKFLVEIGLDMEPQFFGGFDTILGHHALYPTDEQQLELVANKLLGCARYDLKMREWADTHKKEIEAFSYGTVPDEILIPYGAHDADKTLRIAVEILNKLDLPENAGPKNLVFNVTMPAGPGIFEMEKEGLRVDMDRFFELEAAFTAKREDLLNELRAEFSWPDFNPGSSQQKIDLIFGSRFNGKRDDNGKPIRIRPEGTPCLDLTPVKTTGKRPVFWEDVVAAKEESLYSPSTDDETLGMLAVEDPRLNTFRDYAYVSKIVSNFMSEPWKIGKRLVNVKGLQAWLDDDGAVHTHLSQLAETGRWKSFGPNMQNL